MKAETNLSPPELGTIWIERYPQTSNITTLEFTVLCYCEEEKFVIIRHKGFLPQAICLSLFYSLYKKPDS